MLGVSVWERLLGVGQAVIDAVEVSPDGGSLIARVHLDKRRALCCSRCLAPSPRYDRGGGLRRWRHLDAGVLRTWIEAEAPRVNCRECGVHVAHVPWAHPATGHTHDFARQVAWAATTMDKTAVVELIRVDWATVGSIIERYWQDVEDCFDRYQGLQRIGIDEISYKKRHKYLTVVVDHDTGRLVWAGVGRDTETLERFFVDELGPQRCEQITLVSADAAEYIAKAVREHLPRASLCADAFHIVAWATDALDTERRAAWNRAPGRANQTPLTGPRSSGMAKNLKDARWALWKNPENLTEHQHATLAWIATTDPRLHQAYLLKEGLRYVFKVKGTQGKKALADWLAWAETSTIPAFTRLARKIRANLTTIHATLEHALSNARIEAINTKIRLITRRAFGFHHPEPLIALAYLTLGGYKPTLPGRT